MKISKMVKILKKAQKNFGDVDVKLMDAESGNWVDVESIMKLHPYTALYGCLNRDEPVNAIAINEFNTSSDLKLH